MRLCAAGPLFAAFDAQAKALIDQVATSEAFAVNCWARDDLAYLPCMPRLDYMSINNALPAPDDCIPRVTWGNFWNKAGAGIWR